LVGLRFTHRQASNVQRCGEAQWSASRGNGDILERMRTRIAGSDSDDG